MINDAGKHEVKKVLRDRCNGAGLVPMLVSRFRSSQTLAACSDARVGFDGILATFMILVRFLDLNCRNAIAAQAH
jgi:hypothetical protein